jgi:hypothetical protein
VQCCKRTKAELSKHTKAEPKKPAKAELKKPAKSELKLDGDKSVGRKDYLTASKLYTEVSGTRNSIFFTVF